ncbi:MAG: transcription-repair coupling factor [Planctomycetia bacterium]|nr:transcription-repair coupling factor [Planctomycetia bacterium]
MALAPSAAQDASGQLKELAGRLTALAGFADVIAALKAGHGATFDGVWGSSCALVAAALEPHVARSLVVVCPHPGDVDSFCDDLAVFSPLAAERFPAWETTSREVLLHDEVYGERLRVLKRLSEGDFPRFLVTSVQSLMQGAPPPAAVRESTRVVRVGETLDVDELAAWLVARGFTNTTAVELPGEFSRRGGIVDLFVADWQEPVRVELFGDLVESIRRFDISSQRSLAREHEIALTALPAEGIDRDHVTSYMPPGTWFLLQEPHEQREEARRYKDRLDQPGDAHDLDEVLKNVFRFPSITAESISAGTFEAACRLPVETVEQFSGDVAKVKKELDAAAAGQEVFIVCQTQAEAQRLGEVFAGSDLATSGHLHFPVGRLQAGFRLTTEKIAIISGAELFHRVDVQRQAGRRLGRAIDSFLELHEGDLVVHVAHGIARFLGLRLMDKAGIVEEHLELEFDGGTKIYVPSSKIELVQKYVGASKARPSLARIGGKTWVRQKQQAEQAAIDLAAEMLDLQARRASQAGVAFPPDSEWQREFEASFPYNETRDQTKTMVAIKADMLRPQPMDRLICGDVGYGKTELAIRAAFKAVDSGHQVAVLVPTTVLAEQHFRTFTGRMAEYPFSIGRLSRFCSVREEREILEGAQSGKIDIIIGTHRLAQPDVHFRDLGLLIIDEEQRFGVDVKERLKKIRELVDVLTLTATPIPRTLHMALLGLRDISNLETAPADRQPVETHVSRFDANLVRHAVLRELNRGGQIFFVHNRVEDIEEVAKRLRQVVPEARLEIGHGQMPDHELEQVMLRFVNHKFDLLLSTTIIESGLDIPSANTIFINEADRYGLADMHQLRGRVGRYKHRAYCYLLLDPNKSIAPIAARRLRAIEEFKHMGAGFAVAMRDLEIRGAGNILGTEQSGHINAVGYELYCLLLEQSVRRLQHQPPKVSVDVTLNLPGEGYIPRQYVPDLRMKIDLYRRLARLQSEEELAEMRAELVDRFGALPEAVERLWDRMRLRIMAHRWQIHTIRVEDKYLVLGYASRSRIEELARKHAGRVRIVDDRFAYVELQAGAKAGTAEDGLLQPAGLAETAESLLRVA